MLPSGRRGAKRKARIRACARRMLSLDALAGDLPPALVQREALDLAVGAAVEDDARSTTRRKNESVPSRNISTAPCRWRAT
jgi:hypothetical protein